MTPLLLVLACLGAQDVDEAALFSDTTVVATATPAPRPATTDSVARTRLLASGDLEALGQASWKRSASIPGSGDGAARMVGTANIDVRLPSGERALAVLEVAQEARADTTAFAVRELFLDADIADRVWIRAGKQVLQWGRGILWTPTDLVNVEGKTLVERPGAREGATGLRIQIPVGRGSLTAFAPLAHVDAADSLSAALRAEAVVGPAEIALSSWFKKDAPHVVGLDASTGLFGFDLQAGALWLSGDIEPRAELRDGIWHLEKDDSRGQVRASAGIGRDFKVNGLPDRLRIDLEGFWQSEGYDADVLSDETVRRWADTVWMPLDENLSRAGEAMGYPLGRGVPTARGDGLGFLAQHGLFHSMNHAPLYLGAMATLRKFIVPDLSLTLQTLANLEDRSGVSTCGLYWESLHGFHVQPLVYAFWGDPRSEFTLDGRGIAVELRTGLRF